MPITNPDYSILNHEEMAASIGLKAKHIPMLIGSFLEESSGIITKLESAVSSADYSTIKSAAHSIKGSAGNLRFTDVYEMAREMELSAADANASFDYTGYLAAIKKAIKTINI